MKKSRSRKQFLGRQGQHAPVIAAVVFASSSAWAYMGQAVVESAKLTIIAPLCVLSLIGFVIACVVARQMVAHAMFSLMASCVLFAVIQWAPQLVGLIQQTS